MENNNISVKNRILWFAILALFFSYTAIICLKYYVSSVYTTTISLEYSYLFIEYFPVFIISLYLLIKSGISTFKNRLPDFSFCQLLVRKSNSRKNQTIKIITYIFVLYFLYETVNEVSRIKADLLFSLRNLLLIIIALYFGWYFSENFMIEEKSNLKRSIKAALYFIISAPAVLMLVSTIISQIKKPDFYYGLIFIMIELTISSFSSICSGVLVIKNKHGPLYIVMAVLSVVTFVLLFFGYFFIFSLLYGGISPG